MKRVCLSDTFAVYKECTTDNNGNISEERLTEFTRSSRLDQLSAKLSARQLDERLYAQTVDSTSWNDS